MSSIIFGGTVSMLTVATPSNGWLVGYDTDGVLKQKNQWGVITNIKEPSFEPCNLEVVDYIGCVVEDDFFVFDANISPEDPKDIGIEMTDKRTKPHKKEYWDHQGWMNGVLEGNPESLKVLITDGWELGDINYLRSFLHHLKEKGWL